MARTISEMSHGTCGHEDGGSCRSGDSDSENSKDDISTKGGGLSLLSLESVVHSYRRVERNFFQKRDMIGLQTESMEYLHTSVHKYGPRIVIIMSQHSSI